MADELYSQQDIYSDENQFNAINFMIKGQLDSLFISCPAIILSDQDNDFSVDVRPLYNFQDGNKNPVNPPNIYNVPVNYICGGDIGIITRYKKNDRVLLVFSHRDTSGFKETFNQYDQQLNNTCNIQDAFVVCSLKKVAPKNFIRIDENGIEFLTDKDIKIKCKNVNIECETSNIKANTATIDANVNLGGSGGSLVLNADAQILDGDGKPCTISSAGSTKVKAS